MRLGKEILKRGIPPFVKGGQEGFFWVSIMDLPISNDLIGKGVSK
jgi:hypothetical protein